jgi:hypothetical protein
MPDLSRRDLLARAAAMPWMFRLLAGLVLTPLVLGCAAVHQPPPGLVVPVSDVKSLQGTWVGTLIDSRNRGTPARMVINVDGTYLAHFGALSASGTIAPQPSGQLTFTMESGSGPLGPADAFSTATLYDRGGQRVLIGNGRVGFYQTPFSWELTEQK